MLNVFLLWCGFPACHGISAPTWCWAQLCAETPGDSATLSWLTSVTGNVDATSLWFDFKFKAKKWSRKGVFKSGFQFLMADFKEEMKEVNEINWTEELSMGQAWHFYQETKMLFKCQHPKRIFLLRKISYPAIAGRMERRNTKWLSGNKTGKAKLTVTGKKVQGANTAKWETQ